jgi:hypothetical protein
MSSDGKIIPTPAEEGSRRVSHSERSKRGRSLRNIPAPSLGKGNSGYSLRNISILTNIVKEETSPFKLSGFTSSVYTVNNPPKDWCDIGLLLPHEAIRMEMAAMNASVAALKEDYDDAKDDWRVLYFSQWYIDIFSHVIHRWGQSLSFHSDY